MKAIIRSRYGGPELLRVEECNKPLPGKNELLIKVMYTTVNRTDCAVLAGTPFIFRFATGLWKPRFASTGTDFAGIVEAVGKEVSLFQPGQRVFGFNDHGLGSHAGYFTLDEKSAVYLIPENVSFAIAAAASEGAHYAYNCIRKPDMKAGESALVYGATGAIGSAAVQLLKHFGLYVTAVCPEKSRAVVAALNPDKIICYDTEDFTKDEHRYHYIIDAVGKSRFRICKPLLRPGGKYMSSELGPHWENIFLPLLTRWSNKRVVFPIPTDIKGTLALIQPLLASGVFCPLIDRTYSFAHAKDAFTYVNSGQKTGNVLLDFTEA